MQDRVDDEPGVADRVRRGLLNGTFFVDQHEVGGFD
jgi:hypothetical protein